MQFGRLLQIRKKQDMESNGSAVFCVDGNLGMHQGMN